MQLPKISVIVPVYNVEKYLDKCVKSILNNSYKDLEIILVDDGSTDKSGILCDVLAKTDNRIMVIHKKNGGLSSARNAGLAIAVGEYVSFIDSDDYIATNMYESMLNKGIAEDADIIQCGVYRVDEANNLSTTFRTGDWCSRDDKILEAFYVLQMIPVMICNKIFRRSIIQNKRFIEGRNNEDNMFMADILPDVKCMVSMSDQMYYYLIRTSSITGADFTEKKFDSIYAYKYVLNRTKDINEDYVPYVQYWRCKNSFYLWHSIYFSALGSEKKKCYLKRVNQEFVDTYPFVLRLGNKVNRKDRLILLVFNINKNLAVKVYRKYLKGKL